MASSYIKVLSMKNGLSNVYEVNMAKNNKKKRVSKAEWLEAAMSVMEKEGINAVKIERLAKVLKTSRSGFYWHFQDRSALLKEILDYWRMEYTETVIKKGQQGAMPPNKRLYLIMQMIEEHSLDRFEIQMRSWADNDPEVADIVMKVYRQRFDFIRSIFSEMGFSGCDLEMRTRLWLCYATHGKSMFNENSCSENEDLISIRHAILTR